MSDPSCNTKCAPNRSPLPKRSRAAANHHRTALENEIDHAEIYLRRHTRDNMGRHSLGFAIFPSLPVKLRPFYFPNGAREQIPTLPGSGHSIPIYTILAAQVCERYRTRTVQASAQHAKRPPPKRSGLQSYVGREQPLGKRSVEAVRTWPLLAWIPASRYSLRRTRIRRTCLGRPGSRRSIRPSLRKLAGTARRVVGENPQVDLFRLMFSKA